MGIEAVLGELPRPDTEDDVGGQVRLGAQPVLLQLAQQHAPAGTPMLEVPDADHHVMVDQPLAFAQLLADLVPVA